MIEAHESTLGVSYGWGTRMSLQTVSLTTTPTVLDPGTSQRVWVHNVGSSRVSLTNGGESTFLAPGRDILLAVQGPVTAWVANIDGGTGSISWDAEGTVSGEIDPAQRNAIAGLIATADANEVASVVGQTGVVTAGQISTALGLGTAAGHAATDFDAAGAAASAAATETSRATTAEGTISAAVAAETSRATAAEAAAKSSAIGAAAGLALVFGV